MQSRLGSVFTLSPPLFCDERLSSPQVILSAAFTHLLPDAISSLQMIQYPVACACSLFGFLSMVMLETILTYWTLEDEHQVWSLGLSRLIVEPDGI
jgi:hypothetical protein